MLALKTSLAVALLSVFIGSCSSSDSGTSTDGVVNGASPEERIINQQTYQALLYRLLPIIDGTSLDAVADELIDSVDDVRDIDSSLAVTLTDSSFNTSSLLETTQYDCDAGGTLTLRVVAMLTQYDFSDCALADRTYDGSISTDFRRDQNERIFTALEVTTSTGDILIDGNLQGFNSASAFYNQSLRYSVNSATISVDGPVTISNQVLSASATSNDGQTEIEREFSSMLTISGPWIGTSGESLQVQTTQAFAGTQPDNFYTSGSISVTASDGSSLQMNADNGDPATVQVTVESEGVTTADTLNWDDMLRLVCLDDTGSGGEPKFACGD